MHLFYPAANRNPLFEVSLSNQSNINSPSKRLQLRFQATFTVAQCFFKYKPVTSTDCTRTNLTLNETIVFASTNSEVIIINVTLSQSGTYCYHITCTTMPNPMPRLVPIAQGMLEYQHIICESVLIIIEKFTYYNSNALL